MILRSFATVCRNISLMIKIIRPYRTPYVETLFIYLFIIIVTCIGWYASQIRGLLRRLIGFINTSVTHALLLTINYKQYTAIVVDLHFIQLSVAHALGFPVSTSRLPETAFNAQL
jgi:hypothetical protein